ncbi:queuosine precursor transporter [Solimonas marina]|uniref:Probable queuosine precursor transporter n=1 Tax=Solimonas marina TaxID=2714601 RepID=A0A969W7P9_9GAMM|nr:queuosine precursor transporter [Solimonas marina]NKF21100.1 queuosine precursor transporter [Solimonas marina]
MNDNQAVPASAPVAFRYYDFLLGGMVAVLLCSNLIGPGKVCSIDLPWFGAVDFGAGNLFFPISYIFGDVLTEVYGYARARRAIWAGFGAMIFATVMAAIVVGMQPSADEPWNKTLQPALEVVFGNTWRIVAASMLAYWAGDFVNSFVMAKMKLLTKGRHLWTRTIGSTICGQGVDSMLFYPVAFAGLWTTHSLIAVIIFNFSMKVGVEVVLTPLTYFVVNRLKRAEGVDTYDTDTHFTPFSLRDEGDVRHRG